MKMTKTKEQFISQMHDKVFKVWWDENQMFYPLVHTSSARSIFLAGREKMEEQLMKQRKTQAKIERERRNLQSKIDKDKKND
jgi:hypothetical protein